MWIFALQVSIYQRINKRRVDTYEQKRNKGTDLQIAVSNRV